MESNLSVQKTGMTLGVVLALLHALWSLLVLLGLAQPFLNWIYELHFLNDPFVVGQFDILHACLLVIVTGVVGYILGSVFALLWNVVHKKA